MNVQAEKRECALAWRGKKLESTPARKERGRLRIARERRALFELLVNIPVRTEGRDRCGELEGISVRSKKGQTTT